MLPAALVNGFKILSCVEKKKVGIHKEKQSLGFNNSLVNIQII